MRRSYSKRNSHLAMEDNNVHLFGPFTLTVSDIGVAVAVLDIPRETQNILRERYISDAHAMLDFVAQDTSVQGLVIESGKKDSFIAGADVRMLAACRTAEEAAALSRSGQMLFNRLESLPFPVVAAIDGVCLGGGLELALACQSRICTDNAATRIGLPEVKLGLLPGSGGTQRLPRLIGIQDALGLILTGRRLTSRQALKSGIVDEVVPASILRNAAVERVLMLRETRNGGSRRSLPEKLLEGNPLGRKVILSQARKKTMEKSGGHYPAPLAIIDCVEVGLEEGMEEGLQYESRKFGELARTAEAQALMGLFIAGNDLSQGFSDAQIRDVNKVGILGAGLMGAGIAFVSAAKAGIDVRLKDRDYQSLAGALKFVSSRMDKHASRLRLSDFARAAKFDRITTTIDYSGFESVDLVIEAVFEDLGVKQQVLAEVEEVVPEDVIFASNTSSIPISRIASGSARPQNIVGMHYFSPVDKMPLLEVVRGSATSDQAVATAVAVGKRQGKTVVVVNDGPGFFVNRILAPYLNEASRLLVEGVSIEEIDAAMRAFGFPIGPFELMDEVGLDVGGKVVPILEEAFGDRIQSTGVVESMVADGRLGKKSRSGFYSYGNDGKRRGAAQEVNKLLGIVHSKPLSYNDIQKRCISLMVNEAVYCLDDGIISRHSDGDVAAVFGIGFPPFIGGPFRYVDLAGPSAMVARMRAYAADFGSRYEPAATLVELTDAGHSFYSGATETATAE